MLFVRMWGSTFAVVLVAATLVTAGGGASAQPTPESEVLVEEDPQQSLVADAEIYAEQYGVTLSEAVERLSLDDHIIELTTEIRENIPDDNLAYVWVQYEPTFELLVGLKDPTIVQLPETSSVPVSPVRTDYSLADLNARRSAVERVASELELAVKASDINVMAGSVELIFESADRSEASSFDSSLPTDDGGSERRSINTELGLSDTEADSLVAAAEGLLRLTIIPADEIGELADVWAGLPANICTVGYTLRKKSNGKLRVSTAAHCSDQHDPTNPPWAFAFVTMNYKGHEYGVSSDIAWYGKTGHNPLNRARDDNPLQPSPFYRPITNTLDYCCIPSNYWLCKYGVITGKTCGNVTSFYYDPDGSGSTFVASFLRIRNSSGGLMADNGDSGGPVYRGQTAIAYINGGVGSDAVAFSISFIPSDFEIYTG